MATPAEPKYSKKVLKWVKTRLDAMIGASEFAPTLLAMEDNELRQYATSVLGDNKEVDGFVNELISRRNDSMRSKNQNQKNEVKKQNSQSKNNIKSSKTKNKGKQPTKTDNSNQNNSKSNDTNSKGNDSKKGKTAIITQTKLTKEEQSIIREHDKKYKKRRECGCQGTTHECFKNCTECGYIICIYENEGPCFHCGAYVTISGTIPFEKKENDNKNDNSKEDNNNDESDKNELSQAIERKNKLLRFGQEKAIRTQIIDDQGDFYENEATNIWRSELERQRAKEKAIENEEKLNESRADVPVTLSFDVINGKISYDDENDKNYNKRYMLRSVDRQNEMKENLEKERLEYKNKRNESLKNYYQNASLTGTASQVYATMKKLLDKERQDTLNVAKKSQTQIENDKKLKNSRIGDGTYVEQANNDNLMDNEDGSIIANEVVSSTDVNTYLNRNKTGKLGKGEKGKNSEKILRSKFGDDTDSGVCLSMHQPWASLLVYGIKKVEGRSWSTKYRGRLWIASAKRVPTPLEVSEVETQYCQVYNLARDKIPFPNDYPTAALLGCVDLVDCLDHNEYEQKFIETGLSNERNASAYCFICQFPRKLIIPGAISGEHKLWKMPTERLKSMQQGLVPIKMNWIPQIKPNNKDENSKLDKTDKEKDTK